MVISAEMRFDGHCRWYLLPAWRRVQIFNLIVPVSKSETAYAGNGICTCHGCNDDNHTNRHKRGGGVGRSNALNWKKIRAEYIRGGISQQKLADKYGISYSTIKRRALAEGWTSQRNEADRKYTEKIVEKTADKKAEILSEIFDSLDRSVLKAARKLEKEIDAFAERPGTRITHDMKVNDDEGNPKRMTVTYDFAAAVNALTGMRKQLMDERRSAPADPEEAGDNGFIEALEGARPDAWDIADEPANTEVT